MSPQILKLLAILLKHSGEVPNITAKFQAAAAALTTHGAVVIDPTCDLLQAFKPLEADLIAGGFKATAPLTEDEATERFGKLGDGTLLQTLLDLFKNNPQLLALILKLFGIG